MDHGSMVGYDFLNKTLSENFWNRRSTLKNSSRLKKLNALSKTQESGWREEQNGKTKLSSFIYPVKERVGKMSY